MQQGDGEVPFPRILRDIRKTRMWREYLLESSELQAVDMLSLTMENERLAFFLNLYNLMVMHGLVVLGTPADSMERIAFYRVCGG